MRTICPACNGKGTYLGYKCCVCGGCGVDRITNELVWAIYRNGDLKKKAKMEA